MSDQGAGAGKDATEDAGSGGTTDGPTVHAQIATSALVLETANEVLKNGVAAAAATPPPATTPPATVCCDAYPSEALKEALSMPADPKAVPKDLPTAERDRIHAMNKAAVDARVALLRKSAWATAPEMVLLEACAQDERQALAKKMLEVRAGTTTADYGRRTAEKELEEERAKIAKVARETLEVGKTQMEKWTGLAEKGKEMLVVSTIFSAVMIVVVIIFASENKLDATEAPIIIFILAIFAISPAVLLLRERPLEGLDKFTPGGTTGGDSDSAAGGSGEGTAK